MRRFLITFIATGGIILPQSAHSDMFGGDVAVLMQILVQTIQELAQLKALLQSGNDTLGLLQDGLVRRLVETRRVSGGLIM